MSITVAPSAEAGQAIVDQINDGSGFAYTLPAPATFVYSINEDVRQIPQLRVEVCHVSETTLADTLAIEGRTQHTMEVLFRKKLPPGHTTDDIAALALIVRQVWRRINNFRTSRVIVIQCGELDSEIPDKLYLREYGLFRMVVPLLVTVEAST